MITVEQDVTLFLVEDDDVDAEGIERAFKDKRIANPIVRAKDGIDALELLNSNTVRQPYIVLLDLNMPRMGGIEFLEAIRKHPIHNNAVIFVLTTSRSDEDIAKSYEQHISGYFVKNEMGSSFFDIAQLFGAYWKMVKLPSAK